MHVNFFTTQEAYYTKLSQPFHSKRARECECAHEPKCVIFSALGCYFMFVNYFTCIFLPVIETTMKISENLLKA